MSVEGTENRVEKEMDLLRERFEDYHLQVYPAALRAKHGRVAMHALLKLPRLEWPQEEILGRLSTIPPHIAVNVDPENLL